MENYKINFFVEYFERHRHHNLANDRKNFERLQNQFCNFELM